MKLKNKDYIIDEDLFFYKDGSGGHKVCINGKPVITHTDKYHIVLLYGERYDVPKELQKIYSKLIRTNANLCDPNIHIINHKRKTNSLNKIPKNTKYAIWSIRHHLYLTKPNRSNDYAKACEYILEYTGDWYQNIKLYTRKR